MKHIRFLSLISLIMSTNLCLAQSQSIVNISGIYGSKTLDSSEWRGVDKQGQFGLVTDYRRESWPLSLVLDAFISFGDDRGRDDSKGDPSSNIDAATSAIHLGVRKIFTMANLPISPYLGGGLALTSGSQEMIVNEALVDESDAANGYWVGMGVYWRPIKHLSLGVDARYSNASITLFDDETNAGGQQVGVTLGYHW